MKYIFFLALPLFGLDRLTKYLVTSTIEPERSRMVREGFFYLVNITNTGAAFGSFKNNNAFFVILSCLALLFVVALLVRRRSQDVWRDLSLGLLLAGILGNLTDRLLYGHVIDFLVFNLHFWPADPWPAFNLADSCICVAVFCFIIHSFRHPHTAVAGV